ncbi:MAG: hypothetical protein LBE67_11655 [Kocuria palustris]|nr:hypothetical protein [Kocuria palustris]
MLGEAFGVKAVGRRGGGVLPDLGLGVYERGIREVCQVPEKSMGPVLGMADVFVSALWVFIERTYLDWVNIGFGNTHRVDFLSRKGELNNEHLELETEKMINGTFRG